MGKQKSAYLKTKEHVQKALESVEIHNDESHAQAGIRIQVPNVKFADRSAKYNERRVSMGQLAVLLWCLYRTARDSDVGYNDCEMSLHTLNKILNRKFLSLTNLNLERLLYAANEADKLGYFWNPGGLKFADFIAPMLGPNEVFDREWNFIIKKEDKGRIRKNSRYIKSLVDRSTGKRKRRRRRRRP